MLQDNTQILTEHVELHVKKTTCKGCTEKPPELNPNKGPAVALSKCLANTRWAQLAGSAAHSQAHVATASGRHQRHTYPMQSVHGARNTQVQLQISSSSTHEAPQPWLKEQHACSKAQLVQQDMCAAHGDREILSRMVRAATSAAC